MSARRRRSWLRAIGIGLVFAIASIWLVLFGLVAISPWIIPLSVHPAAANSTNERLKLWLTGTDRSRYVYLNDGVVTLGEVRGWPHDNGQGESYAWLKYGICRIPLLRAFDPENRGPADQRVSCAGVPNVVAIVHAQLGDSQAVLIAASVRVWFPLAIGSLWLLFAGRMAYRPIRRWRRRRRGICVACGYDLRGNASGVCSECGAAAAGIKPRGVLA